LTAVEAIVILALEVGDMAKWWLATCLGLACLVGVGCGDDSSSRGEDGGGGSGSGGQGGSGGAGPPCDDTESDPLNCGTCGHDCGGGECAAGKCQPVVLVDRRAWRLASNGTHLYWSDGETINRVPVEGGASTVLVTEPEENVHNFRVLSDRLVWRTRTSVRSASPDGSDVQTLASDFFSISGLGGVALNATDFYCQRVEGEVVRVPLAGGIPQTVQQGLHQQGLALDASDLFVVSGGGLLKVARGGGAVTTLYNGDPFDVAVHDERVYWTEGGEYGKENKGIFSMPKAGGEATMLAASLDADQLAVDATHVYWSDDHGDRIRRVPIAGGTTEDVATEVGPRAIAMDDRFVYWSGDSERVFKLAK